MSKNLLISLLFIPFAGYMMLKIFINRTQMDWGHHFTFNNELGVDIDSLEIEVGALSTIIRSSPDYPNSLEGNILVPEKNYPHKVVFTIYSQEEIMTLKADSFNCYNCDGSHGYHLKPDGAEYFFSN